MKRLLALGSICLMCAFPVAAGGQETKPKEGSQPVFSFYGLRFGMTPAEVGQVLATNEPGSEALTPGHGMTFLVFSYDYRGRLQEIRASYGRPREPLQDEALRRALREKFFQPIGLRWHGVSVSLDEYSNQAALTMVLTSLDQREEVVNHFRDQFLKQME